MALVNGTSVVLDHPGMKARFTGRVVGYETEKHKRGLVKCVNDSSHSCYNPTCWWNEEHLVVMGGAQ